MIKIFRGIPGFLCVVLLNRCSCSTGCRNISLTFFSFLSQYSASINSSVIFSVVFNEGMGTLVPKIASKSPLQLTIRLKFAEITVGSRKNAMKMRKVLEKIPFNFYKGFVDQFV